MGTSTNCSAFCGRQTAERCGIRSREILGTAITCSTSARAQEVHHPVTQLRHRHIEDLHVRHDVLDVRRCVPLCNWQWPHLNKRCRPGGKHVPVVVQTEVHLACRPGERSLLAHGVVHLVTLLSPGPCHRRSPWSSVVRKLGKGHCDAQAFVAKELPELSLPPSHGGSRSAVDSHVRQHEAVFTVRTQNRGNLAGKRLVLLLFVVVFGDPPPSLPYQTLENSSHAILKQGHMPVGYKG